MKRLILAGLVLVLAGAPGLMAQTPRFSLKPMPTARKAIVTRPRSSPSAPSRPIPRISRPP